LLALVGSFHNLRHVVVLSSLAGVYAGQNPCRPTSATSSALCRGTWPEAVTLRTWRVALGYSSV